MYLLYTDNDNKDGLYSGNYGNVFYTIVHTISTVTIVTVDIV